VDTQDPNETPEDQGPPQDPNAPTRHTLPSGKVVQVRSHRTMTGDDGDHAICSQTGGGARGVYDVYNNLAAAFITEIEPGKAGKPRLDGTVEAVKAQRIDDYNLLHGLVKEHYALATGRSVIPDLDEWQDPKAPTRDSSAPRPD
jgi:hypothetical protein